MRGALNSRTCRTRESAASSPPHSCVTQADAPDANFPLRCGVREHATSAERTSGARSGFLDAAREALDRVGTARRRPSTKCKPAIVDLETLRVALLPHVPAQADAPDANFPLRCGVREHATSAERTSGARSCFLDAAREALDRVGAARRRPTARKQKAPLPRSNPPVPSLHS